MSIKIFAVISVLLLAGCSNYMHVDSDIPGVAAWVAKTHIENVPKATCHPGQKAIVRAKAKMKPGDVLPNESYSYEIKCK